MRTAEPVPQATGGYTRSAACTKRPSKPSTARITRIAALKHIFLASLLTFSAPLLISCTETQTPAAATEEQTASTALNIPDELTSVIQAATLEVSPTTFRTIDTTTATLTVTFQADAPANAWRSTNIDDAIPDGWEVRQRDTQTSVPAPDTALTQTRTYTIAPELAGTFDLGPITLSVRTTDAQTSTPQDDTLAFDTIEVTVLSVLDREDEQLAAIRSVTEPPPLPLWLWALVAAGILTLIAAATAFALNIARHKASKPKAVTPADELALRALNTLEQSDLIYKESLMLYYNALSTILRQYIENRFDVHAPERTTEEFLREAQTSQAVPQQAASQMAEVLKHCDMVKFARASTDRAQATQSTGIVRTLVQTHGPKPPASGPAPTHGGTP